MRSPVALSRAGKDRQARQLTDTAGSSGRHFSDEARRALVERDIPALDELGARAFLLLMIRNLT